MSDPITPVEWLQLFLSRILEHVLEPTAAAVVNFLAKLWEYSLIVVLEPLQATDNPLGYVFLFSSLVIALIIYTVWSLKRGRQLSVIKAFRFVFPKHVWQHPFAWLDVKFSFLSRITGILIMTPSALFVFAVVFIYSERFFIYIFPLPIFDPAHMGLPLLLFIALTVMIATDLFSFFTHYLQHKIPFLWELHKVHHSALVMHPLTNHRMHLLDGVVVNCGNSVGTGLYVGFLAALLGYRPEVPNILDMGAVSFLFIFSAYHLRHSHIWLVYKPYWLGYVLNSPAHHQIHHSKATRHLDTNFGNMFSCWDWLFGTLYLPKKREKLVFGLADNSEWEYNTIWRMYWVPLAKIFRLKPLNIKQPAE